MVQAIIWNVAPNVRKDALLMKQARLIDLFRPVDIWNNVMIICKQSRNPEDDGQGALAAAHSFNPDANPTVLGYTYADDASLTDNQRRALESKENRKIFLVKTDQEVRTAVAEAVAAIGDPIKVVFKNHKCLDCGATGDVRLMPIHCHMEPVLTHPGSLIQYHPRPLEKFHDSSTVLREHPKGLYRPWYSLDLFICKIGGERHLCCGALANQVGCQLIRSCCKRNFVPGDDAVSGCKERFQCCKIGLASRVAGCKSKYDCCDSKAKAKGCKKVCKKCDRPWGSSAEGCYEKPHNVITSRENQDGTD